MKIINRRSMLYKTGVEYGDYTINHVQGCAHGCKYPCYAMMMAKRFGKVKTYEDWCEPKLAGNALEILDKEIPRYKDRIKSVQLCLTTDPFMYGYKYHFILLKFTRSRFVRFSVPTNGDCQSHKRILL